MIDDQAKAEAGSSGQAVGAGGTEKSTADEASKTPSTAKPVATNGMGLATGQPLISLSLAESCNPELAPEDQVAQTATGKDAVGQVVKADQQQVTETSNPPTATTVTGDSQHEIDMLNPASLIAGGPAPANSGKQSTKIADDDKPAKQADDADSAAPADQVADDSAPLADATLNAQPATAIIAVVDPAAPVSDVLDQLEPQHVATLGSPAAPTLGKAVDPSPDTDSQPHIESQPLTDKTQAVDLPLVDVESDADLDEPAITADLEQAAEAPGKKAQGSEPTKVVPLLLGQPQAAPAQADAGIAPQNPGLTAQSQSGNGIAASQPSRGMEVDPQASAPLKADRLPKDLGAAPKSFSTPSATLAFNGVNIAIAAGPTQDPAAAAVQASPQSAPAALVPVSGIAVEIASKALAGKNRFEIRLDPPELGRIHVRLDVDSSGQISSHVVADRSDTLDLLRRDAPSLERALQDAGLKTSNNGLQFSLRDHGGFARQEQPLPMPANARLIVNDEALPAETMPHAYRPLAGLRSGLDIRV